MIEVLLLHRHMDAADVTAGITAALSVGAHTADIVAVEARKAAEARGGKTVPGPVPGPVPGAAGTAPGAQSPA